MRLDSRPSLLPALLGCLLIFAALPSHAATPAWTCALPAPALWQRVTPLGNLLVCTQQGLHGVDVQSGKVAWTRSELAGADEAACSEAPGTPYVMFSTGTAVTLVDPFSGAMVYDSRQAQFPRPDLVQPLFAAGCVVVCGTKPGGDRTSVLAVDMASGRTLWTRDGLDRVMAAVEAGDGGILLVTLFSVHRLNAQTGAESWKGQTMAGADQAAKLDKALGGLLGRVAEAQVAKSGFGLWFHPAPQRELFMLAVESKQEQTQVSADGRKTTTYSDRTVYNAYRMSDGALAWPQAYETPEKAGMVLVLDQGFVVASPFGDVNCLSFVNGGRLWGTRGRGISMRGTPQTLMVLPEGLVAVCGSENDAEVNVIDPQAGTERFERSVRLKGAFVTARKVPAGMLFVTTREITIVDMATGQPRFEKPVATGPGLYAIRGKTLFSFDAKKKAVVRVDLESAAARTVEVGRLEFDGGEEATAIEIRPKGVLLTSAQNLALVTPEGLAFHRYYPAPQDPGWVRALNIAAGIRAAYIGTIAGMGAAMYTTAAMTAKDKTVRAVGAIGGIAYRDLTMQAGAAAKEFFTQAARRYKATEQARECMFMVTETSRENQLVQVDKNTGEIRERISLRSAKKPVYVVDDVEGRIYHLATPQQVACYAF